MVSIVGYLVLLLTHGSPFRSLVLQILSLCFSGAIISDFYSYRITITLANDRDEIQRLRDQLSTRYPGHSIMYMCKQLLRGVMFSKIYCTYTVFGKSATKFYKFESRFDPLEMDTAALHIDLHSISPRASLFVILLNPFSLITMTSTSVVVYGVIHAIAVLFGVFTVLMLNSRALVIERCMPILVTKAGEIALSRKKRELRVLPIVGQIGRSKTIKSYKSPSPIKRPKSKSVSSNSFKLGLS